LTPRALAVQVFGPQDAWQEVQAGPVSSSLQQAQAAGQGALLLVVVVEGALLLLLRDTLGAPSLLLNRRIFWRATSL